MLTDIKNCAPKTCDKPEGYAFPACEQRELDESPLSRAGKTAIR